MAHFPTWFEPQPIVDENDVVQPWELPDTLRRDQLQAQFLAASMIKQLPEAVLSHVYKDLKILAAIRKAWDPRSAQPTTSFQELFQQLHQQLRGHTSL